eukprot:g1384.t1
MFAVFPPESVYVCAHFRGVFSRMKTRRKDKAIRWEYALNHPAQRYIEHVDMHPSNGNPLGTSLSDEWTVTEVTFGRAIRGLCPILAFCFASCGVTYECMRCSVATVASFLGVPRVKLLVSMIDCNKRYRVTGHGASGGWWGRLEIVDITGRELPRPHEWTRDGEFDTDADSIAPPGLPATSTKVNDSLSPRGRRTSEGIELNSHFDLARRLTSSSPVPRSPKREASRRRSRRGSFDSVISTMSSVTSTLPDDDDGREKSYLNRQGIRNPYEPGNEHEAMKRLSDYTEEELDDYCDHAAKIHDSWLVRINRDASKSWGTHRASYQREPILELLKRTKLLGHFPDQDLRATTVHFAHYLVLVLSRMCFGMTDGDDNDSERSRNLIPISSNFKDFARTFRDQVILGIEPETGCIDGNCLVEMADGTRRRARDVVPGDLVRTSIGSNRRSRVVCTVHQLFEDTEATRMCRVADGCSVTPEHPVRFTSDETPWTLPFTISRPVLEHVDVLCNFVLERGESGHCVIVGGVECVSLGHESKEPSIQHSIWGGFGIRRFLASQPDYPRVTWRGRFNANKLSEMFKDIEQLNRS